MEERNTGKNGAFLGRTGFYLVLKVKGMSSNAYYSVYNVSLFNSRCWGPPLPPGGARLKQVIIGYNICTRIERSCSSSLIWGLTTEIRVDLQSLQMGAKKTLYTLLMSLLGQGLYSSILDLLTYLLTSTVQITTGLKGSVLRVATIELRADLQSCRKAWPKSAVKTTYLLGTKVYYMLKGGMKKTLARVYNSTIEVRADLQS